MTNWSGVSCGALEAEAGRCRLTASHAAPNISVDLEHVHFAHLYRRVARNKNIVGSRHGVWDGTLDRTIRMLREAAQTSFAAARGSHVETGPAT